MLDSCKMVEKQSEAFHTFLWHFFPSLKQNFIAYRSSKVSSRPNGIFEIHQLWQWGFSRVYSNCCCSCWFEAEIIKIGQSSHKMYSNNILNFQECTTILNVCTKKSGNLLKPPRIYIHTYIHTYMYAYIYAYIYKHNMALNNLQMLICNKTQPTNYIPILWVEGMIEISFTKSKTRWSEKWRGKMYNLNKNDCLCWPLLSWVKRTEVTN